MTGIPEALERLAAALAEVVGFDDPAGWSDDDLLAATAAVEAVGRVVDARRAACAGEIAERSRVELSDQRLSTRRGCRSATELIERVTQVSGAEARRRIALGSATRARASFVGEPLEAEFPAAAAALAAGQLGADAAGTIVRELDRTRRVADPAKLDVAEYELVAAATGTGEASTVPCTADELRVQAQAWAACRDQDGLEPDDERAMGRRGIRLGRARDGLVHLRGELMPEVAAKLTRLFDAHLSPRSGTGFMTDEEAAHFAASGEQRTSDQQRHDVFAAIVDTAGRSGEHPTIGGAARAAQCRRHGARSTMSFPTSTVAPPIPTTGDALLVPPPHNRQLGVEHPHDPWSTPDPRTEVARSGRRMAVRHEVTHSAGGPARASKIRPGGVMTCRMTR